MTLPQDLRTVAAEMRPAFSAMMTEAAETLERRDAVIRLLEQDAHEARQELAAARGTRSDMVAAVRELLQLHAENEALQQVYDARQLEIDGLGNKRQEGDMASQLIGTTETGWFNTGVSPPPFDTKLLLMVAGSRSEDCGRTFEPYTVVMTAYVKQQGPCDEYDDEPAFDEYMSGGIGA